MSLTQPVLKADSTQKHQTSTVTGGLSSHTPASFNSTEILRGQKAVEISHNGLIYRLQATRLGKLILTK